jgi:hypothetical protein
LSSASPVSSWRSSRLYACQFSSIRFLAKENLQCDCPRNVRIGSDSAAQQFISPTAEFGHKPVGSGTSGRRHP